MVIKVNGQIIAKSIHKELKPGLEVSSNEKFDFKTPVATASFIDPKSGKIFQLNVKKNIYLPDVEIFEDRGIENESLYSFFSDTVIFYKRIAVTLPSNLLDRFSKQDYALRILTNKQDISMPLKQSGNLFILQNDSSLNLRTGYYDSRLCSIKKNDGSITILSNFVLLIPDSTNLLKECSLIKKTTPDSSDVKKNIFKFIKLNYGKISESDMEIIEKNISRQ
jgi:hypothetical protein